MHTISIFSLADQETHSNSKHHQSFKCLLDGHERFLCDYYSRANVIEETELIDLLDAHNSLHIKHTTKNGKHRIDYVNADHSESWHMKGNKLMHGKGGCIAQIIEPKIKPSSSGNLEEIAKFDHHQKNRFVITDANNTHVLASAYQPAPANKHGNFVRNIKALIESGFAAKDQEIYRIKVNQWPSPVALLAGITLNKYHALQQKSQANMINKL